MSDRSEFRFRITYFKLSGKLYLSEEVRWEMRAIGPDDHKIPYIYDAVSKLRGLRDSGSQGAMPGLSGSGWDGPILIQHLDGTEEGGLSHLLLP